MKLVNHGAKLQLWELDTERSRIYETVHRSGLASLTSCSHQVASRPMLSAFCERWQPETTTFHLPFGEMTITLDDVASILHIPVTGSMISFSQPLRVDDANALLVELLSTTDVEASRETEQCRSPLVRLLWLRDHFSTITDVSSDDDIEFSTRAFLLHLVGCTLFVTPPIPVRPDWRIRTGFGVQNHILGLLIFFLFFFFRADLISVVYK